MASARNVKRAFFPLDEELALLPGQLTPLLQDQLAHLGAWMPFSHAARMLTDFTRVSVSESSAQRLTEAIGIAYEAVQLAEVERIERDWPEVEPQAAKLVVSADGAMVALVGGEWAEVKTVVVSEVGERVVVDGKALIPTHTHSYFSRLSDAETFQRLSLGELTRRGLETAEQLAAVNDGAEWIQGFLDYHCPQAVRILDFAHAAERVCQIGDVVLGEGAAATSVWRRQQLHDLKHEGANDLIASLRAFAVEHLRVAVVEENLAYLEKRVVQMQYGEFQAQGWPIGSGVVESGNKLVMQARLKGAGMHWARASVNPLLTLRNAVCNDRWIEAWQQSSEQIRRAGMVRRRVTPKRESECEEAVQPVAREPAGAAVPAVSEPPKATAQHPWRQTNYATKARIAAAKADART